MQGRKGFPQPSNSDKEGISPIEQANGEGSRSYKSFRKQSKGWRELQKELGALVVGWTYSLY